MGVGGDRRVGRDGVKKTPPPPPPPPSPPLVENRTERTAENSKQPIVRLVIGPHSQLPPRANKSVMNELFSSLPEKPGGRHNTERAWRRQTRLGIQDQNHLAPQGVAGAPSWLD